MEEQETFAPWKKGFIGGSLLVSLGVVTLFATYRMPPMSPPAVLASFAMMGLGGMWLKSSIARWSGKQVEQKSIRSLKIPESWTATPNWKLPGGGDADLVLESDDGDKYAVEIKSLEDVIVKPGFLMLTQPKLVRSNGKKITDDPLNQARKNAEALAAIPVLWCPNARKRAIATINGVKVVLGPNKLLYKALGIKRLGIF